MSDQPIRDESVASFAERVTIDILTDRPPTQTFDMYLFQQDPAITVRLEGKLTDARGENHTLPDNAVLIFSSEGGSLPPTVVYNKDTGQRERSLDDYNFAGTFRAVREDKDVRYLSVGNKVDVSFVTFGGPGFTD